MTSAVETTIDVAHAAMINGGEEELLAFYKTLLSSELFLILEETDGNVTSEPKLVPIDDGWFVLAFDTEERVRAFSGRPIKPMKLLGSWLINLLYGRGTGIALNMGEAPSAIQIPADALDWIHDTVKIDVADDSPAEDENSATSTTENSSSVSISGRLKAFMTPRQFPESVGDRLRQELHLFRDQFSSAILLRAEYEDGHSGYLLAIHGVETKHKSVIAAAITEAIAKSGRSDTPLDVTFLAGDDPHLRRISEVGLPL